MHIHVVTRHSQWSLGSSLSFFRGNASLLKLHVIVVAPVSNARVFCSASVPPPPPVSSCQPDRTPCHEPEMGVLSSSWAVCCSLGTIPDMHALVLAVVVLGTSALVGWRVGPVDTPVSQPGSLPVAPGLPQNCVRKEEHPWVVQQRDLPESILVDFR